MHVQRAAMDHWTQKLHPGRSRQFRVKGPIEHAAPVQITFLVRSIHVGDSGIQCRFSGFYALFGDNGRHRSLDRKAYPHHFGGGAQGGLRDDGAAIAAPLHKPLLGQKQKRLAHGALAAPELVRQRLFDQMRARLVDPEQDRPAQRVAAFRPPIIPAGLRGIIDDGIGGVDNVKSTFNNQY